VNLSASDVARFMAKVSPEPNTGCWLWTGTYDGRGYGILSVNGKKVRAHRIGYAIATGHAIPDGELGRHRCDVRACCNGHHVIPGSHADNSRDMVERGRCLPAERHARGERNGSAKLTADKVREIRRLGSEFSQRDLALAFGVSRSSIRRILSGEKWAHVASTSGARSAFRWACRVLDAGEGAP
jgi:hypothetical protein